MSQLSTIIYMCVCVWWYEAGWWVSYGAQYQHKTFVHCSMVQVFYAGVELHIKRVYIFIYMYIFHCNVIFWIWDGIPHAVMVWVLLCCHKILKDASVWPRWEYLSTVRTGASKYITLKSLFKKFGHFSLAGFSSRHCMGQLFAAMLRPSALGRQET